MTFDNQDRASLMALLDWYRAIGVDAVLGDEARDRFGVEEAAIAPTPARRLPERNPAPAARRTPEPAFATPAAEIAAHAVTQASGADNLVALRATLNQFEGCALKGSATQLVLSGVPEDAALMIVGDAPGSAEDASGQPFSGRSGPLLDAMLAAIGQDRTRAHLAHLVPWRPPGNRAPTPPEIAACLPFLHRQIAIVRPKVLICFGELASRTLLGISERILAARGRWTHVIFEAHQVEGMAMLSPDFLLGQPSHKKSAWRDLQEVQRVLEQPAD